MRTFLQRTLQLKHYTMSQITLMNGIREQKAALRKFMRSKLRDVTARDVADQSVTIVKKVFELPAYKNARAISVFLSMPEGEIATRSLVLKALDDGKKVFVPYVHKRENAQFQEMDMLELYSEQDLDSLKADSWGIPTLREDSIAVRENAIGGFGIEGMHNETRLHPKLDLIFVPALAFDRVLGRLGHGKGFYDRYLEKYKNAVSSAPSECGMPLLIGLALKQQLLADKESVPVGDDDWRVDQVITATD